MVRKEASTGHRVGSDTAATVGPLTLFQSITRVTVLSTAAGKLEQDVNELGHPSPSLPMEENLLLQLHEKVTILSNLLTFLPLPSKKFIF